MRLIDADAFKEYIDKYMSVFSRYDLRDIKMFINEQPTIEAKPVRHGKWIYKEYKTLEGEGIGYFVCSECGHAIWNEKDNYCFHCGAKMDEVNDE